MNYPLLLTYTDLIIGDGFVAKVRAEGRALMTADGEEGEAWVYGVNPGGLSAHGNSQHEAAEAFRKAYRSVLLDIVSMPLNGFSAFKTEVETFFNESDKETIREWEDAVLQVRQGKVTSSWLKQQPANRRLSIQVEDVTTPNVANNSAPDDHHTAVAA